MKREPPGEGKGREGKGREGKGKDVKEGKGLGTPFCNIG